MNTRFGILAALALATLIGVFTAILALGVISPLGVQGAEHPIEVSGQAVDFQSVMVTDVSVANTNQGPGEVSGFPFSFVTAVDLMAHQDTITVHFDKDFKGHGANLSRKYVTVSASHSTDATTGDSANITQTGAYNPFTDAALDRLETAHPDRHTPAGLSNADVLNNIEYLIDVPDMNGDKDGSLGIAAGSTVTLTISPAAGITNATEGGNKGPIGVYTSKQQQLVYGTVRVDRTLQLSNYGSNRNKALSFVGKGFQNGTIATVYLDNAYGNRLELVSVTVATDDTFQATFTVTVPPFVPGKGKIIYAEDNNQPPRVSNRVEFKIEGLLTVSPTSAAVGDEIEISLVDWPDGPIPAGVVTIAGVTQKILGSPGVNDSSASFRIEIGTATPSGTNDIKVTANGESDVQKITIGTLPPPVPRDPGSVAGDRAALVALYNATDGANWTNNTNWLTDAPLGQWYGVETDSTGRVILLYLSSNRLTGQIPLELGSLTVLYLGGNQLTGCVPAGLWIIAYDVAYHDITELGLLFCASVGDRAALVALYNATDGANWTNNTNWLTDAPLSQWYGVTVDPELRVDVLHLNSNGLTGEIPEEMGGLTNLLRLDLGGNRLTGQIPLELGSLTNLATLNLGSNRLTGEIPVGLGKLTNLTKLELWSNQLSREIPTELGNLTNLTELDFSQNPIIGEIPAELGGLTNLKLLRFKGNQLSGEIPAELGDLTSLEALVLSHNRLSGEIPDELGNLTNLEILRLSSNRLSGCILEGLRSVANHDLVELGLPFCDMLDGSPVVVIRFVSAAGSPVRPGSPVSLDAAFSEPVSGFTIDDISVANGAASNFSGSGAVYTFDVTPNAIGEVAVYIDSGVAEDADGNGNIAARLSLGIPYDDDGDGMISRSEAIAAISDYFDEIINREQVIAVITLYLSG